MAFGNFTIKSKPDLIAVIDEYGFLPFFENSIDGFSIEEHISPACWWHGDTGEWSAWEWKGPVIKETGCAYGKFFEKKACYISKKWFPVEASFRYAPFGFKFLPTVHSFWVFFDCTFLDNSSPPAKR